MGSTIDIDEHAIGNQAVVSALKQLDKHQVATLDKIDGLGKQIELVMTAFPGKDFEGHRRYHETMIEMLAERRRLRQAVQEKTISGLVWAGIVGVGVAVVHEVQKIFGGG